MKTYTEYQLFENASGLWQVMREVADSDKEYQATLEIHSTYKSPREGQAMCMQLNGHCGIYNPLDVMLHFYVLASKNHHGGAKVAARLLLGIYDSDRFLFPLGDLNRLDEHHYQMAMVLLEFSRPMSLYIYDWLNRITEREDFADRLEWLAHKWDLPGQARASDLSPVSELVLTSPME